jgi:ferritin
MDCKVLAALNKQIQHELTASYIYLGLAAWFEHELFKGFAAWMRKQVGEERSHAMKLFEYVQDRGGQITLGALEAPKTQFASVLEAFKAALAFEKSTTAAIHAIADLARSENDLATLEFIQWYIKEQVEEEQWAGEYVAMAEKIGDSVGSMYMFDHRVGKAAAAEAS